LTLAALALITLGGPWGAYRVSLRSQRAHLVRLLEANGLWRDGRFRDPEHAVPFAASKELSSTVSYLIRAHGSAVLRPLFGAAVPAADSGFVNSSRGPADQRARQLMSRLGLAYVSPWEGTQGNDFWFSMPYVDAPEAARTEGLEYHSRIEEPGRSFVAGGRR